MFNKITATTALSARLISALIGVLLISASATAQQAAANAPPHNIEPAKALTSIIEQSFRASGYRGSFVTHTDQKPTVWHGTDYASKDSSPASTFKIFLALVGLETGALKSADEIIPWNRLPYPDRPEWQKDMALRAAMQSSSESYFQVLAERIGQQRLADWVQRLGYGNQQMGPMPKRAWHDGIFQINSAQQVDFMHRLQVNKLPIKLEHLNAVRKAMLDDMHFDRGVLIYSKTGTALVKGEVGVGWWVGFVDHPAAPKLNCAFALKVELKTLDARASRIAFGKKLLQKVGCLKPTTL